MKAERSTLRLILGLMISLITLTVLIIITDEQQVILSIQQIDPVILIPVLILLIISLIIRAGAWRIILKERISLKKSFLIINSGYFVNSVLPFRLGEIARAFLLMPSGLSFWEAFPTIILERLIDVGFTLGLFFIGLPFAVGFSQNSSLAYLFTGLIVVGITLLFFLVKYRVSVINWFAESNFLQSKWRDRLVKVANRIISSLDLLENPTQMLKVFLLMLINWVLAVLYQYLLIKAFMPDATLVWAAFTIGVLGLGISIPSSPGNIGVYEASITIALAAFGVDQEVALAYGIATHIISVLVTTLFGSFGLINEGFALRDIYHFRTEQKRNMENE